MHGHRDHSQHASAPAPAQAKPQERSGCCGAKPSHDAIAHRAYDIYVKAGSKQGHCKQNWQQAETELQSAGQVG